MKNIQKLVFFTCTEHFPIPVRSLYMNHLSYVIFAVSLRVCIYFTVVDFLNLSEGGGTAWHFNDFSQKMLVSDGLRNAVGFRR